MNITFETVRSDLIRMDALMNDLTTDEIAHTPERIYRSHLAQLNRLAATLVPDKMVEQLISDQGLAPVVRRIARMRRLIGSKLEIQSAQAITSHPDPWSRIRAFTYYPNYLSLARMEVEGGRLKPGDRVLFLGSGPLPLSLICLSKEHGIQGVGIEQDRQIAELSKKVIERLELSQRISILHGDHFLLPLKEASALIMVGADAVPKKDIFEHLARVCPSGQMISYRIYEKGLRRLLDDQSMFELPTEFSELARIHPAPPVNNTCVFAVRGG
jgi:precorrin-6B methylase 2